MGTTVDSLEIQLQAQATKANTAIDTLITKLGTLNTSLTKINGSGLSGVANGVDKLSRSMQGLKNVGTADYTRLAKGIEKISNLDSGQISKAANAIVGFGKGLQSLNSVNVSKTSEQVADLAKGIAQLGYSSSTKAIENIPKLASAMRQLMSELSKAPKVSQNLIDMTNALAKLARTGASSGRAANALGGSLNTYTKATHKASRGTKGLASALGKMYATYWLLFRSIGKIGDSITIASDLVEVQNVVDTVFGDMSSKVEEYAQNSIKQFGMSELSFKQYASRFQAMGSAMGIDTSSIESANSFLNKATGGYVGLSDSMADVSLTLTQLTADMASFYNVSQKDVAEDLAAIFTGETRPLRQYGIDLTQATLQEWAMKNGLDANVQSMSQAEKTMLRYQYVLANTSAAHGDFARTMNTWHNQVVILQEQIKKFASIIGTGFIAAFKPFLQTLNMVMAKVIDFTQNVLNALGQIFGWKFEISGGGITEDLGDVSGDLGDSAGSAGDLSDNLGNAAANAKKLKNITLGIDELNINAPQDDAGNGGGTGGSGGSGSGGVGTGGSGLTTSIKRNESMLEAYKSSIKTLEQLGDYIGDTLANTLYKIPWTKVYEGARNFGKGLADFLNGLISPTLFGAVGRTIANSLNTAIYAALSFGQTFDFYEFGTSIATGINEFFRDFDFASLAETLNVWVDGIKNTIIGFLNTISGEDIISGATEFLSNLEIDTVTVLIGAIAWKLGAGALLKTGLVTLISKGIGKIVLNLTGVELGKVTFVGVAKAIGTALKKAIGSASGSIVSFISGALGISGGAATTMFAGIISAIAGIGLAIKDLWDTSESFRDSVSEMWEKISEAFENAKIVIWDNTLLPLWEKLQEFVGAIQEFWNTIYSGYESSGLKQLFEDIVVSVGDKLATGIANAINVVSTVFGAVGDVVGSVIDILTGAITFVTGVFSGNWDKAWTGVKDIVRGVVDGISGFFKGLWNTITAIFSPTIDFFDKTFSGAYNSVKDAWSFITTWFQDKWNSIKSVFQNAPQWFKEKFGNAYNAIVNIFKSIGAWFGDRWTDIKNVFSPIVSWFSEKFSSAYTGIKNVFSGIGAWFGDRWTDIKNVFSPIATWFSEAFQKAYDGVKNIWDGLGEFFKGIARNALSPIETLVNGIIKGINWVLDKVGADDMMLNEWSAPQFAKGSDGVPQNTLGVVNDQPGSTYKELIVPPHGKPFIPNGRNVMLPLEKGTKIMPANQTKALMSGMPHFAGGIGDFLSGAWEAVKGFTGDVFDYLKNPGEIVKIALDKFVGLGDFFEPWLSIAGGIVNLTFDGIVSFVSGIFDKIVPKVDYVPGAGVEQWRDLAKHALQMTGQYTEKNLDLLLMQMGTESGGNPNAINNWDINAQNGTPSKGLMQVIDPTFRTYAYPGYDTDIYDPLSNILASIQYTLATYGSLANGWRGVGYANGIGKISLSDLFPAYSVGGFPEDGLFMANHTELVGQFANGKTAVANNLQIEKGIEEAAYRGVSRANMENREQENLLRELIRAVKDGKRIVIDGRELVSVVEARQSRNGFSFT